MSDKKTLFADTETRSKDERWQYGPREFNRLFQYAWGRDGDVQYTSDYDEMIDLVRSADLVVGHNFHAYDLSVLFGKDSIEPLEMALAGRVFDTWTHATLILPAPDKYTARSGHTYVDASKPGNAERWFSLDNLCFQLGLDGKEGDLKALAKKYGGFDKIPLDDPEFIEYAVQDVHALRELAVKLLELTQDKVPWDYAWREQKFAAINAQMSRNGFRVDTARAQARVDELAEERDRIMAYLVERYDFPTAGKKPWQSNAGKDAIFNALAEHGIAPKADPTWPKTKTGAPTLGGQALIEGTEGTPAEELGRGLATLAGQRSLAQLALDSVQPDGKAHPDVTTLQRSGRSSLTKPGLTVWGQHDGRDVDKVYFIASEGRKLVEYDYSVADARIVAAYSGDEAFKERFAPGVDSHELTGRLVFGDELYDSDPGFYRQVSKAFGHAYAYRAAPKTLARNAWEKNPKIKQSYESEKAVLVDAERFVEAMEAAYPRVTRWQRRVTAEGEEGFVVNDWGRRMPISFVWNERFQRWNSRAFTQAPALLGQSGTREIVVDALIRIAEKHVEAIRWLVATVHDALVWDIPESELEWAVEFIRENMETTFEPSDGSGQAIHFPVNAGIPSDDWQAAGHG